MAKEQITYGGSEGCESFAQRGFCDSASRHNADAAFGQHQSMANIF
ncbi:hypothetical protein SAMN05421509_10366 [Chromohalobacter canadensis]|uniref:Uncharacterized protein n=1 Tax=Chromohalobacter canadensis TaxID=141389 RepID=A0A285VN62_9GAMM|nr:hypothetical protein SAMN05421509_10366 [Chromohalobacter canadensis]